MNCNVPGYFLEYFLESLLVPLHCSWPSNSQLHNSSSNDQFMFLHLRFCKDMTNLDLALWMWVWMFCIVGKSKASIFLPF